MLDACVKKIRVQGRKVEAIILEDVNLEGMKRFNKGFAKTVTLDFSWSTFTWMLRFKMEWLGKYLIMVDRFFPSSKTCSHCGHINDKLKLTDRTWTCPECGIPHERDENAAKNLRKEGMRLLREVRNVQITKSSTAGTAGSHASGDRVRPTGAGRGRKNPLPLGRGSSK